MKKLKGGTLIEVLSSLALLSMLFVVGSLIFQRLGNQHAPNQQLKTRQIVASLLVEPLPFPIPEAQTWEIQGRNCERRVSARVPGKGIVKVKVACYWGEELLEERHKLIRIARQ